jgi:hypothetical protein
MTFLEKELEQIIFEADNDQINERGLPIWGKKYRQLRIGNYGIADLITVQRFYRPFCNEHEFVISIYELKRDRINISTFLQILSYAKGIKSFFESRFNCDLSIIIYCVGKHMDMESSYIYLSEFLDGHTQLRNYTYKYEIDGIRFAEQTGFKLTKEGF